MYIILFDSNNQARFISQGGNITKDDIYLFESLPEFEPRPGYANSLHLNDQGQLEWHFTKLPDIPEPTEDEKEAMHAGTEAYQYGYDRAVLDEMGVEA